MTKLRIQPTTETTGTTFVKRAATTLAAGAVASAALVGAPGAASAATSVPKLGASVIALTNAERALHGCKPLKPSARLAKAAQRHAADMAAKKYFSHTSADGTAWNARIRLAGWKKPGGENIAYGYETAVDVVGGWMNSPGHRRNILDCRFAYIGVGVSADGSYWVQDFGY